MSSFMAFSFFFFCFLSLSSSFAVLDPVFPSFLKPEIGEVAASSKLKLYKTKYFTQILDHFNFNPRSYRTFQQRYLINKRFWGGPEKKAPLFVYTGNEGNIEWFAENTGFMEENAPSFGALLVFIEHRYYGKSIPFGSKNVAYSNATTLGYLTSTQALADYATLILDLKKNLSALESPVVLFGGSYGGMLAAWLRLKYPHIAIGALASSAPILGFEGLTSSYSFNNIITTDFQSESEKCYQVIKGSWKKIDQLSLMSDGLEKLRNSFGICKNYMNVNSLKNWIRSALIYTAMTDYPTPSNFLNPLPAYPVRQMCRAIDNSEEVEDHEFAGLYRAMNIYYNYTGKETCFDLKDNSDTHGIGAWIWQACTEMILPTSGNSKNSIFPASNYDPRTRIVTCESYFNVKPRPQWIPTEFGGHEIERTLKRFGSNIIFFNGLRDPWSGGGVLKNLSSSVVAIVAKEGAHHVDLRYSNQEDPEWLQDVRRRELQLIREWLTQYYHDTDIF